MFLIEKIEGVVKIEKHRPIMLIDACRKACTGILIKRIRRVWDKNQAISPSLQLGICQGDLNNGAHHKVANVHRRDPE